MEDSSTATLELVVDVAGRTVEGRDVVTIGTCGVVVDGEDDDDENDEGKVTLARVEVVSPSALLEVGPAWGAGASSGEEFPSHVEYTATYSTSSMFP